MVERKLYKTRLCMLYQRGRCSRQHCNFAHGDVELRRSFNGSLSRHNFVSHNIPCDGRQDYHGRDLRESLRRKRSPVRTHSPGKDNRARLSSHGNSPSSPGRRIDRNHRKRHRLDGLRDYSGSFRMSDETEDRHRERRQTSDSKVLQDELRQVQAEIKVLDNDKRQMEVFLEKKAQENDNLTLKIHEIEMQLSKEKDEAKRITSKIKKFVKAHNRHLRLQEELKRSNAQIQKLGDHLDLDVGRSGSVEEDPKVSTLSEDEMGVNYASPMNEIHINSSPSKKRSRVSLDALNALNTVKGDKSGIGKTRLEKLSRQTARHELLSGSKKPNLDDVNNGHGHLLYEDNHRKGIYQPPDVVSAEKAFETGYALPPTGLAAHAVDEDVDVVETDETGAASNGGEAQVLLKSVLSQFPPPPPPPVPQNVYSQYEGNDEHVDIDELDDEAVEVDIV